jgi:acyl-CoA thioesterase-1
VNRRCFLLTFLALLLFPHPRAHAADTRPIIVCFGDSITAGLGVDAGHTYPDYLQQKLDARGYHYHVVNKGISGNTSKDAVSRLKDVLSLHPEVVIVEFGGNDGLRGFPIQSTQQNLDQVLSALRNAHIKIVLAGITLPPNYGADYIHQFDQTYRQLAAKYHTPLLPMLYANVYNVPGAIQEDGIHPTAKGADLVANNFLPLLFPLLHK